MRILGIDYGRRKIGLAVSTDGMAEPYKVIRFKLEEEAIKKVSSSFAKVSEDKQVDLIVIGMSEGKIAEETKEFGKKLEKKLKVPVVFQDETLTTQEAQELARSAGVKRKKRQSLEDAYSATLILQSYIDENI
jgi:putative Holliday junction resolvase